MFTALCFVRCSDRLRCCTRVHRLHPRPPRSCVPPPQTAVEAASLPDGYQLRQGDTVVCDQWALGRRHEMWDAPDSFFPERFMQEGRCVPAA